MNKLNKVPSGIAGFDEISQGGIPKQRTTLVLGTSGAGKTVFGTQFLYNGVLHYKQGGVFITFEEKPKDIIKNMKSFGWNIEQLIRNKKWAFVDASPEDADIVQAGEYDLSALLARIRYAISLVGAKRIIIDSVSALFPRYEDHARIRRELYRIDTRLKEMNMSALMTAERPSEESTVSRFGVEEFVSDNVILLRNRLTSRGDRQRTIEILKYRGSGHETGEVPFIFSSSGIEIFAKSKPKLIGKGFSAKIGTGITGLNKIFHGGVHKNSTTLLCGASGTGKTVAALHFIIEGAKRGQKGVLIEFEESPDQLFRNAASFGWDLHSYVKKGTIKLICHHPEDLKSEQYLKLICETVIHAKAHRFALDSLSALERIYETDPLCDFIIGLIAFLKMHDCTSLLTNTSVDLMGVSHITASHLSATHLATATDNIILLKYVELGGHIRRMLTVLKARGSQHTKELVEYEINNSGFTLVGPFSGVENLLGGNVRTI